MPELKTSIEIEATPGAVWSVLSDFDRYGDWNPFIRSLEGPTAVGDDFEVALELPNGRGMTFRPEVLANDEAREFRWLGRTRAVGVRLVDGEHYFLIEPIEGGHARLTQGEYFTGLFASPMMWFMGGQTREGFESMNAALKERVEANVAHEERA